MYSKISITSRGPGTKILNPFLKTFEKMELKICNTKSIILFARYALR